VSKNLLVDYRLRSGVEKDAARKPRL